MGMFGFETQESINLDTVLKDPQALQESFIYDELSQLSSDKIQEFVNSNEAQVMVEKGLIGRKTLVRLSKKDDVKRRTGMANIQLAKDRNDILYKQLIKTRERERDLLRKIDAKYENIGERIAKTAQATFLKNKIPKAYMRA